ncbi:hypothetical protein KTR10_02760 [Candidatus Kaiserbacteria bacterium]|nr:hypothetical protein [Candidatus Kaiserbacteria bacterium]
MFNDVRYGLIIDIGSAQIDVALIESTEGTENPRCLYTDSFQMNLSYAMTVEDRIRKVRRTLREAYRALDTDGLRALRRHGEIESSLARTLIVFRPPWSRTATRKVFYRDVTPFTVNTKFLESLFETLEKKLEKEYKEDDIAHAFDFDIIEHAVVETKVDGKLTEDPLGMEGQEIMLRHYTGLAPEQVSKDITSIQERTFPEVPVTLHSCQYISYRVLAEAYPDLSSFCIITIADEATEVAVIINGTLRYATVLGTGSSTIMGQPWEDARIGGRHTTRHIRSLIEGTASEEDRAKCQKALWEYGRTLREALIEIEKHLRIPRTTMVLVPEEVRGAFVGLCEETLLEVIGESSTVFVPEDITMDHVDGAEIPLPLRIAGHFFHKLDKLGERTQ